MNKLFSPVPHRLTVLGLALTFAVCLGAMSLRESQSASAKLNRVSNDLMQPGEVLELSDEEINSFLHYDYASELPEGIRGLRVRFDKDIGIVTGNADFSKMSASASGAGRFLLMMLSGERPFDARVRYVGTNGQARVDVESFKIDGREMKGALLDWVVNTYVAPSMDGFELGKPIALSHNLDSVRLDRGVATLTAAAK
ncbi:MAG: hypothetical protein H6509_08885 [Bryobacterales bacterium]|nr:hypothetical protein [Bryobacterales bacterium]